MKVLLTKDKNKRTQYSLFEKKKIILKSIVHNTSLNLKTREYAYKKYISLPTDSSITKIRNRCVLSNRPRAVYKKFKISRLVLRDLSLQGNLMGIKKASW